ncbi:hypothetical protein AGMMS50229_19450 [Campylobacterota bacterium]|nr:hypothetical protein AGMMS50229_19450 [Campylobacterota bacterium]
MVLIGIDGAIDSEKEVVFVESIAAVINGSTKTPNGSLLVADFSESDLPLYGECTDRLAIRVSSVREFVIVSAAAVRYALCDLAVAPKLQQIADHYLSDTKVLAIAAPSQIEEIALLGVDGIFALAFPAMNS